MTIEVETRFLGIPVRREKLSQGVELPLHRPALAYTEPLNSKLVEGVKGTLLISEKRLPDIVVTTYEVLDDDTVRVTTKRSKLSYNPQFQTFEEVILKGDKINQAELEFPTRHPMPEPNPNPLGPPLEPCV